MQHLKDKIKQAFEKAKDDKIFDRAVVGVVLPNGTSFNTAFNTTEDSVFDIASLTKVCPTSTLALHFILRGDLSLETPVASFIPELKTNYREGIQVKHLLTHTLDYRVPMSSLKHLPPQEILDYLFSYQFDLAPGTAFNYGNPASILLGILLQRLTGQTLAALGESLFFKPLGMSRSGWEPLSRIPVEDIVPTEVCSFRNQALQGIVHDESAFVLQTLFPVGSAGMFSTVPDLMRFVTMLLQDGVFQGQRVLDKGILNLVSKNALEPSVKGQTALGWELNNPLFMGTQCSSSTFGKTGFTGASIVADAKRGAAIIFLSNFTWPQREKKPERIFSFRSFLSDLIFKEID